MSGQPDADAGLRPPFEAGMTGSRWLQRRFIPVVIASGFLGIVLGLARGHWHVYAVGIQGMAVGGVLGYLAARLGRSDPPAFWTMGQRAWLGAAVTLGFTVPHLIATSVAQAGPIDPPLYWLGEVVDGLQREPFVSWSSRRAVAGTVEGGWWVAFAALDALLFWFLFVGLSTVGGRGERSGAGPAPAPNATAARTGAIAMLLLTVAAGGSYSWWPEPDRVDPFSLENVERISRLAGFWTIDDGRGVFGRSDGERQFGLTVAGYNALTGTSAAPGGYHLSLTNEGDDYRGMLTRGNKEDGVRLQYFRMRPSADGRTLTMVFTVFGTDGRRDVVITARKR